MAESFFNVSIDKKPTTAQEAVQGQLGNAPCHLGRCPFCQRENVTTVTEQRASGRSIIALFFSVILMGPYSFLIIPLIGHFLANIHHFCPRCEAKLGVAGGVSCMPKVHNDLITIKVGNCATIMSKKVLYGISAFLGGLFLLKGGWDALEYYGLPDLPEGPPSFKTWPDYVKDCGIKSSLGHPLQAHKKFADSYDGHTVNWKGTVKRVELGIFGKNTMIIGMPTVPDVPLPRTDQNIIVVFDRSLNEQITNIAIGATITFKATPMSLSNRSNPAIFFLHHIYPAITLGDGRDGSQQHDVPSGKQPNIAQATNEGPPSGTGKVKQTVEELSGEDES